MAKPRKRGVVLPLLLLGLALAVLVALGSWQLERKAWKESLIAELDGKLAAPATDLPPRERWEQLAQTQYEFRHVAFPAALLAGEEGPLYTTGSSMRPRVAGTA